MVKQPTTADVARAKNSAVELRDSNVTDFLAAIVTLGHFNYVSDDNQGIIYSVSDDKPRTTNVEGKEVPYYLYGGECPEGVLVNPFADTNFYKSWFYNATSRCLAVNLKGVLRHLLEKAAADNQTIKTAAKSDKSKKKGSKQAAEEASEPTAATALELAYLGALGDSIADVDDKVLNELDVVFKQPVLAIAIIWDKKRRECLVSSPLLDKSTRKGFTNVRASTWTTLEKLTRAVLGMKDDEDVSAFTYAPTIAGIPVFESFLNIYVNLFARLRKALTMLGVECDELDYIRKHMKFLSEYHAIAKWAPSADSIRRVAATATKSATPVQTVPAMAMPGTNVPVATPAPVVPWATTAQFTMPQMTPPVQQGYVVPGTAVYPQAAPVQYNPSVPQQYVQPAQPVQPNGSVAPGYAPVYNPAAQAYNQVYNPAAAAYANAVAMMAQPPQMPQMTMPQMTPGVAPAFAMPPM